MVKVSNEQITDDLVSLIASGKAKIVRREPYIVNGVVHVKVELVLDEGTDWVQAVTEPAQ